MAKTRQTVRARVTQTAGRRRKKPASRVERMFDEVKALVEDTGGRVLGRSDQAKKAGGGRIRSGQQRQAAAKKAGAARVRSGQQRQAAAKQAARSRRRKTS